MNWIFYHMSKEFKRGFFVAIIIFISIIAIILLAFIVYCYQIINVDTFRYLFSAMAQTLGAIIALSATFFVLIYGKLIKEKEDYYNRLVKIYLALFEYKDRYQQVYDIYENSKKIGHDIKTKIQANQIKIINLENALKDACGYSEAHLIDLRAGKSNLYAYYANEIFRNIKRYNDFFDELFNFKNNLKFVFSTNILFIIINVVFLALTDIGFITKEKINMGGALMLIWGICVFIIGLYIIYKSIINTIKN